MRSADRNITKTTGAFFTFTAAEA